MTTKNRQPIVYGMGAPMYCLQQNKPLTQRFIRLTGHVRNQSGNELEDSLQKALQKQIQINSFWAWVMLLLAVLMAALIPCWMMSGKMEFFIKNAWRFLVIGFYLIPFVMYEQRIAKDQKEKLKYCMQKQFIKPIFLSTFNFCIYFALLIHGCKFSSMNHVLALGGLRSFFVALIKIKNGQRIHEFEVAGTLLTFIGIVMLCTDSVTLPIIIDHQTRRYLRTDPWKRLLIGDAFALTASLWSVYWDMNMKVPDMPRFTHMFLYNLFTSINLVAFAYFFGGSSFDFHTQFGIFGIFTYNNLVQLLYVGLTLGFIMTMMQILAAQIFNEIIINIANNFRFILTSLVMQTQGLQLIMSGLTPLGYCFIVPGMTFIVAGQSVLTHSDSKLSIQVYNPPDIFCPKLIGQDNRNDHSMLLQKQKLFLDKSHQNMVDEKISQNSSKEQ